MTQRDGIVAALLRPINTAAIIILGVYTFVWGLWLASPLWDVYTRAPLYSRLASIPEGLLGVIAMTAGVIISYGAYRPSYHALTIGAATGFLYWFVIAVFYFLGDWQNTGGITCLAFAAHSAYVYTNIRVNHRKGHLSVREMLK